MTAAHISVLHYPPEGLLQESSQTWVMVGQGFSDETPFHKGCCSCKPLCKQPCQGTPVHTAVVLLVVHSPQAWRHRIQFRLHNLFSCKCSRQLQTLHTLKKLLPGETIRQSDSKVLNDGAHILAEQDRASDCQDVCEACPRQLVHMQRKGPQQRNL